MGGQFNIFNFYQVKKLRAVMQQSKDQTVNIMKSGFEYHRFDSINCLSIPHLVTQNWSLAHFCSTVHFHVSNKGDKQSIVGQLRIVSNNKVVHGADISLTN